MKILHVTIFLHHMATYFQQPEAAQHVIRKRGTDNYVNLGPVSRAVPEVTTPEDCANLCATTSGCRASMLLGTTCNLYQRNCGCEGDRISSALNSKYRVFHASPQTPDDRLWEEAREECVRNRMHLVAINDATEQLAIKQYIQNKAPDCEFIYTSGWSPVPGSRTPSHWRWNISELHTEPVTYTNWDVPQPDNYEGVGQDVITLMRHAGYEWGDLSRQRKRQNQYCHVCECTERT